MFSVLSKTYQTQSLLALILYSTRKTLGKEWLSWCMAGMSEWQNIRSSFSDGNELSSLCIHLWRQKSGSVNHCSCLHWHLRTFNYLMHFLNYENHSSRTRNILLFAICIIQCQNLGPTLPIVQLQHQQLVTVLNADKEAVWLDLFTLFIELLLMHTCK